MAHEKKTLWVGDVMSWMDETYLVNLFQLAGGVTGAKVIRDRVTNQPVGYGFVEFESHEKAAKVLQLFSTSVNPATNKPFKLNWGVYGGTGITGGGMSGNSNLGYTKPQLNGSIASRQPTRTYDASRGPRIDAMAILKRDSAPVLVYVGDLDITVDNEVLLNHFKARCPGAQSARIIVDLGSQLSKGYGFVTFENKEDADDAMHKMNGTYLRGKPIKVKESFLRNAQTSATNTTSTTKKEKMTPLQIQRMYQQGGSNPYNRTAQTTSTYGVAAGSTNMAAQQQLINLQQYQYMIALQQQQILQQQQMLMQLQQLAKKEAEKAEAEKEKEKKVLAQTALTPQAPPVLTTAQVKIQQLQHLLTLMYYQLLAAQNPAYLPYFQQQLAAYQIFLQAYGKQLAIPQTPVGVAAIPPTPVIAGPQVPVGTAIARQIHPQMIVTPLMNGVVKSQAYLNNQQNMLRKRDPLVQQAYLKGQKKLKSEREREEKSELDECPKVTTMMFMNEFNIDVC